MIPVFETASDRSHEREICDVLERTLEIRTETTSTLSDVDFYGYRGVELVVVGEIKYRNVKSTEYGYVYFDAAKAQKLSEQAREYYVPGIVVLRYTDGLFYMLVSDVQSYPTVKSSRKDRGAYDRDQDAHLIPPHMLRRLK